jgi:outer membrane receptor protein involved in Fe transport
MYGVDFTVDYTREAFTAYGNFSAADAWAKGIASSEFEFDADELALINSHDVHLDQTQYYTASVGASYQWMDTTFHTDAIYGDGIRAGLVNLNKLSPYYPVNLGVEHVFKLAHGEALTLRADVLNVFDQTYILNDGTGIGEGAVKYGSRRSYFGGISFSF